MMWFILGAIGLGALCALGGSRRTVNNYYTNDGVVETECDNGGSSFDSGYESCSDDR